MDPILGQGLGNIVQTGLQAWSNSYLANKNFNNSVKMWNMQNEYNTPANQMQRFRDAGLNPNLMYGQGNSGNAQGAPEYQQQAAEFDNLNIGSVLSQYQDIRLKKAQEDNVREHTREKAAEADIAEAQAAADTAFFDPEHVPDNWQNKGGYTRAQFERLLRIRDSQLGYNKGLVDFDLAKWQRDSWNPANLSNKKADTTLKQINAAYGQLDVDNYNLNRWLGPIGSLLRSLIPGLNFSFSKKL